MNKFLFKRVKEAHQEPDLHLQCFLLFTVLHFRALQSQEEFFYSPAQTFARLSSLHRRRFQQFPDH